MSDLIERRAATDALRKMQTYKLFSGDDMLLIDQAGAMTELMMLPSAQPEIIVCEDCKWRISENRKTTSLWLPCRAMVTPDQFSCIYAERREVTE